MLGIEKPYFETTSSENAVSYNGHYYKRGDRFGEGEAKGQEVRLLQTGRDFYFVNQPVANPDGERKFENGQLTISRGGAVETYPAAKLSASELYSFYKLEIPGILKLVGLYCIFLVISIFTEFGKTYWLQSSANKVIQKLRTDIYAHMQRLPVYFFDTLPAGKVVSRITNDTEAVKDLFVAVLSNFSSGIIYITGVYIALFLLDVRLGLICLFVVPLLIVWIVLYRKFATIRRSSFSTRPRPTSIPRRRA
ncbi:ABC transporter transmembrane domain-containing protein [Paenibacillus sp. AR247]|uniref:ABC transporter transmembrane domain-containing protein n=1 Tax=Paenibacillus sp. AR247 TaxID=1631599 RepID=UPI00215753D1